MIFVSSSCVKENRIADVICRLAESGIRNIELSDGICYLEEVQKVLKAIYPINWDVILLQYTASYPI